MSDPGLEMHNRCEAVCGLEELLIPFCVWLGQNYTNNMLFSRVLSHLPYAAESAVYKDELTRAKCIYSINTNTCRIFVRDYPRRVMHTKIEQEGTHAHIASSRTSVIVSV